MAPITLTMYWVGRDLIFPEQCTLEVRRNALELVTRANGLFAAMAEEGIEPAIDRFTNTPVASGWRPRGVNSRTANAAEFSTHIYGEGIDVQDHPDRRIARWCLRNLNRMLEIGIWAEDPRWTGGLDPWVHWQSVPPRSGRRIYIPNSNPPIAAPLPEQQVVA